MQEILRIREHHEWRCCFWDFSSTGGARDDNWCWIFWEMTTTTGFIGGLTTTVVFFAGEDADTEGGIWSGAGSAFL